MSASLVGSEMCIRDRYSARGSGELLWLGTDFLACSLCTFVAGVIERAVSYTHLTLPTICSV
eukprot:5596415-Alexandrium_andersonii.AAC.1